MANQILLLRSLMPLEALQILAGATMRAGSEGIEQIQIRSWTPLNNPSELKVNLAIPDPGGRLKPGPRKLYEALDTEYRRLLPDSAEYLPLPDNYLPLRDCIAELLQERAYNDPPARQIEQEYLLVVPGIDMEAAARIFSHLAHFTTSTSMAPLIQHSAGALHLFHVLHDRQRGSAFQSLVHSAIESPLLAGYDAGEGIIFADPQNPPGRSALSYFAELVRHAPNLFGANRQQQARGQGRSPLAALVLWPGTTPVLELLYLRNLSFVSQVAVEPHKRRYSRIVFSYLKDSPQAEGKLREAINDAAFRIDYNVGYTLSLRQAQDVHDLQRERVRLQAQKEDLENRLEYIDSIEPARPRLLRFTEEQLPALGDFVGSFAIRVIEEGAIKYAFQSLSADGAGIHYLLVDPRTAYQERIDPLPAWERTTSTPISFWLDPYWARYYHGRDNSLIFVPKQTYLSPMMHPPSPEAMDAYLRAIVSQWFSGRIGVPAIPNTPLYIFESDLQRQDQIIITILDHNAFVPLTQKLDWINAHLHLRVARRRGDQILKQIDENMSTEEILSALQQNDSRRQQALDRVLHDGAAAISNATGALTELLTVALQELLGESVKTRAAIAKAQADLRTLVGLQTQVTTTLTTTQTAVNSTQETAVRVAATTEDLRRNVEVELQKAQAAQADTESRVRDLETLIVQFSDQLANR